MPDWLTLLVGCAFAWCIFEAVNANMRGPDA